MKKNERQDAKTPRSEGDLPHERWARRVSSIEARLELLGALVAYRGVTPPAIVPALDVPEDRLPRLLPRPVVPVVHQLRLERPPEALHRRVVVAVADAAHADTYVMRL